MKTKNVKHLILGSTLILIGFVSMSFVNHKTASTKAHKHYVLASSVKTSALFAKCGGAKAAAKKNTTKSKCGDGKCGEGKAKKGKKSKCGEGKCGDGKNKMTHQSKQSKCGDGKPGAIKA